MAEFYNPSVTITPVPVPNTSPEEDTSSWIKCEFCDYKCPKKDRLSRHVRNVHYKEKPHFCHLCDATFGRKDKLKRHLATVHSAEKPFKCDFCPHSSGRKDKIREHMQSVHLKTRPRKSHKKKKIDDHTLTALPRQPIPRPDLVTLTPLSLMVPSQAYLSSYDSHPGLTMTTLNQPLIWNSQELIVFFLVKNQWSHSDFCKNSLFLYLVKTFCSFSCRFVNGYRWQA